MATERVHFSKLDNQLDEMQVFKPAKLKSFHYRYISSYVFTGARSSLYRPICAILMQERLTYNPSCSKH